MRKLIIAVVVVLAFFGTWYFASPWYAMKSLADAARAGDVAALEGKVDFPAVRQSAREQLGALVGEQQERGGLFGMVPEAIVERAGREVIDRAVNADSLGTLVATGAMAAPFLPEQYRTQPINWTFSRIDFDHFRGVGTFEDGTPGPQLLFRRDGAGWLMTGFELPPA